jgi:hypothetical protein
MVSRLSEEVPAVEEESMTGDETAFESETEGERPDAIAAVSA